MVWISPLRVGLTVRIAMTPRHIILVLAAVNIGLLATLGLVVYWVKTSPPGTVVEVPPPIRIENTVTQISVKKFNATNLLAELANRKIGWRAIESTNYLFYIRNLRAIGCPEQTVRDIIIADIANLYARRRASLRAQLEPLPYWQTHKGEGVMSADQTGIRGQLMALDQEQRSLVSSLLGVDYGAQVAKYLPGDAVETYMYAFLTPEKQVALQLILQHYGSLEQQVRDASGGVLLPADREQLRQLAESREQELASLMTPEEMAQYTMMSSPLAGEMRRELYGFEPSREEFDEIFKVRQAFSEVMESTLEPNRDLDPELREQAMMEAKNAVNAELASVLGEERFAEYTRALDPDYQSMLLMTERLELPESLAERVYAMKKATQVQRDQVLSNPQLTYEQRRLALQAMQAETKASLSETMGEATFEAYQKVGSDWLQDLVYVGDDLELILADPEVLEGVDPVRVAP